MFDRLSDRIATAVVTGLDVAVEFATLGEYRLAAAPEAYAPRFAPPRPERAMRVFDAPSFPADAAPSALPSPATAAVREPAPRTPPVLAICSAARTRGTSTRPRPRTRGGAIRPPEQLCLWT